MAEDIKVKVRFTVSAVYQGEMVITARDTTDASRSARTLLTGGNYLKFGYPTRGRNERVTSMQMGDQQVNVQVKSTDPVN